MNTEADLWTARQEVARLEAKLKAEAEKDAIPVGTLVWAWWQDVKRLAFAAGDKQVSFEPGGRSWKCDRVERVDLKSLGVCGTISRKDLIWLYQCAWNDADSGHAVIAEEFITQHFPEAT